MQPIWLLKIRLGLVQNLFSVSCDAQRFDKAAEALVVIAELTEKIVGSNHQDTVEAYSRAADFHKQHGSAKEAERLYKKSRELGGAPNTVPPGLELTPEEIEAERRDQAIMQAAAMLNQQMGSTFPSPGYLEGAVPINNELLYWSYVGNIGKVKIELQKGANVNKIFTDGLSAGHTALHIAAINNHVELVKFLLSVGADPHAKTPGGETALDLAKSRDHDDIVAILQS